jgi:hypothetical protein
MEQLTTYRAKGKEIGLVFLFKYDLNGNLKLFEISEGELSPEQTHWLFTGYLPKDVKFENLKELMTLIKPNFPQNEAIMQTVWMKDSRYTKLFTVECSPADLSFEALWDLYGYKESRKDALTAFKKLKEADIIKCFIQVPKYKKKLAKSTTAQALLASWLNKERFNDEYPEETIKVGKVFNPMLQDLANKKTNRRV